MKYNLKKCSPKTTCVPGWGMAPESRTEKKGKCFQNREVLINPLTSKYNFLEFIPEILGRQQVEAPSGFDEHFPRNDLQHIFMVTQKTDKYHVCSSIANNTHQRAEIFP